MKSCDISAHQTLIIHITSHTLESKPESSGNIVPYKRQFKGTAHLSRAWSHQIQRRSDLQPSLLGVLVS